MQGEFCGQFIQKNNLNLKNPECFVFTVVIDGRMVSFSEFINVNSVLGTTVVPIEEQDLDLCAKYNLESLLERAKDNYSSVNKKEGIVIRPWQIVLSKILYYAPLSIKIINNKYLIL